MPQDDKDVAHPASGILEKVARYYTGRIEEFGPTPRGVDWNSPESQLTRFAQLSKAFGDARQFSLNDLGCGYGALLDHLAGRGLQVDYRGFDISPTMVLQAAELHRNAPSARFSIGDRPGEPADFCVASGIFNVKLDVDERDWMSHVERTIDGMNGVSKRAFAFNCLTSYSDPERRRTDLFYADPRVLFERCMRMYSRNVALLHDYGLFEFTLIVRKNP